MSAAAASGGQVRPQYEFSTDEEADFEEYGIEVEDGLDDDDELDVLAEEIDDSDEDDYLDDGNPSNPSHHHGLHHAHLNPG